MNKDIKILDAHHHFWDLDKNYYPFLSDKIDNDFFQVIIHLSDITIFQVTMVKILKIIMLSEQFIVKLNGIGKTKLVKHYGQISFRKQANFRLLQLVMPGLTKKTQKQSQPNKQALILLKAYVQNPLLDFLQIVKNMSKVALCRTCPGEKD